MSLEVGGQGTPVAAPGQTAPTTDTPSAGGDPNNAASDGPADGDSAAAPAPAYTPNFTYRIQGKEKEFDQFLRNAIKDQESEKRIRDLYTRSEGLDIVKAAADAKEQRLQEMTQEHQEFNKTLEELSFHVQNDDLQSFFDKLKIPKEQVLRYALREVQFAENPQARAQYEAQRQFLNQQYNSNQMGQHFMSQYEQAAVGLRERELDFSLRQPETVSLAESFDSRVGRPGAFRDEVISRGQFYYQTRGVDVPVDQVVRDVIQIFGLSQGQGQPGSAVAGANGMTVVQGSRGKPVLPNIPSSGQSAVKKQITGIAQIKDRYNELMARG